MYTIKIDGSGNGDCAVVVYRNGVKVHSRVWRGIASTNNEAEYSALINALNYLEEAGIEEAAEIYSDSQLVCRQIAGEYSVKKENLKPLYVRAKDLLDTLANVKLTWVPREKVSEADELMRNSDDTVFSEEIETRKTEKKAIHTESDSVEFGLVQMDIIQNERDANLKKIMSFLERGSVEKKDILLFPETCITGFPSDFRENMSDSAQNDCLREIAAKCGESGIAAGIGFFKYDRGKLYNCYSIIGKDGSVIGEQCKQSLFALGNEDRGISRGSTRNVFEFNGLKVKVAICFEVRFPEIFFESELKNQPDVFIIPANWPAKRKDIWESLLKSRAIENQSWVLGINRTSARKLVYTGPTLAVSPTGDLVAKADIQETILSVSVVKKDIEKFRNSFDILPERSRIYVETRRK